MNFKKIIEMEQKWNKNFTFLYTRILSLLNRLATVCIDAVGLFGCWQFTSNNCEIGRALVYEMFLQSTTVQFAVTWILIPWMPHPPDFEYLAEHLSICVHSPFEISNILHPKECFFFLSHTRTPSSQVPRPSLSQNSGVAYSNYNSTPVPGVDCMRHSDFLSNRDTNVPVSQACWDLKITLNWTNIHERMSSIFITVL